MNTEQWDEHYVFKTLNKQKSNNHFLALARVISFKHNPIFFKLIIQFLCYSLQEHDCVLRFMTIGWVFFEGKRNKQTYIHIIILVGIIYTEISTTQRNVKKVCKCLSCLFLYHICRKETSLYAVYCCHSSTTVTWTWSPVFI